MQTYYLGADIGGTKTLVYIADQTGQIIGVGRGGSGNHEVVGFDGQLAVLSQTINQALSSANIPIEEIAAAGFGIAGYDWSVERKSIDKNITTLLGEQIPFTLVNDALVGLVSGSLNGWGIGVVSGTGCNCWGWDETRTKIGRVTGAGSFMGEGAGASEIIQRAIQMISYEWSCRGPKTDLSRVFMEKTNTTSLDQLLEGLIREQIDLNASFAPLVFEVAQLGDDVARDIVRWAATELAELAKCVIRQLDFQDRSFDVVTIGSVINSYPQLSQWMAEEIHTLAPQANVIKAKSTPAAGGVILAMEKKLGQVPVEIKNAIITSACEIGLGS
jgi:N-acetylglucosamine kinase-like BadF-type ATPase